MTDTGKVLVPFYLGKFLDSLATHVERLILFMHVKENAHEEEYCMVSSNVNVVNLGPKLPAYIRFFFASYFLNRAKEGLADCDKIIVRGPSPLAHGFCSFADPDRLVYLLVGSYGEGAKHLVQPWYRQSIVRQFNLMMHMRLLDIIRERKVVVNSHALFEEYRSSTSHIQVVHTTTLTQKDVFMRNDTCLGRHIRLLYVGRLDFAKGILECIRALGELNRKGIEWQFSLHLVGKCESKRVEACIKNVIVDESLQNSVFLHGEIKNSKRLFQFYRSSDIYLIPSYHEGFPRTIWEAFVNCLPVISSDVGGIPHFLENGKDALLIKPKNVELLVEAIVTLLKDGTLRRTLIMNGFAKAHEVMLEVQTKKLLDFIAIN